MSYQLCEDVVYFMPSLHHRMCIFLPHKIIDLLFFSPLILNDFQIFLLLLLTHFYSLSTLNFLVLLLHSCTFPSSFHQICSLLPTLCAIFVFPCPNIQAFKNSWYSHVGLLPCFLPCDTEVCWYGFDGLFQQEPAFISFLLSLFTKEAALFHICCPLCQACFFSAVSTPSLL